MGSNIPQSITRILLVMLWTEFRTQNAKLCSFTELYSHHHIHNIELHGVQVLSVMTSRTAISDWIVLSVSMLVANISLLLCSFNQTLVKNNLGRKGFIFLSISMSWPIIEGSTGQEPKRRS